MKAITVTRNMNSRKMPARRATSEVSCWSYLSWRLMRAKRSEHLFGSGKRKPRTAAGARISIRPLGAPLSLPTTKRGFRRLVPSGKRPV